MDTIEKQELAVRTRQRNALTWLSLDYGGIMAPLVRMETDLDVLATPGIENFIAISDESWGIKEDQRDKTVELSQTEVDQDRLIADAKAATGRAKIAIERAADEYVLAAKIYDAKTKGLIMGAKEYAALVEQEQLAVEEAKSGLAVDKEVLLRREKVRVEIYQETVQQAQAGADLARADLAIEKEGVHLTKVQSEIFQESVLQAQSGADLAKTDLAVTREGVHQEKFRAEIYLETVPQAQAGADLAKNSLAIDKEALHLTDVKAKTYLQTIEQAQVEADIAKAQVDVAKAHVRAAMAGIEAGEAEIKLIEAQTQVFIAEAEKATLQADVASIFAEIMTKKLSETVLGVKRAEITAGYAYIQSKLDDALAQHATRTLVEYLREEGEVALKGEVDLILAVEKATQDLRQFEIENEQAVFNYKEGRTTFDIARETALRQTLVAARKLLLDLQTQKLTQSESARTAAQRAVDSAAKRTYAFSKRTSKGASTSKEELTIY